MLGAGVIIGEERGRVNSPREGAISQKAQKAALQPYADGDDVVVPDETNIAIAHTVAAELLPDAASITIKARWLEAVQSSLRIAEPPPNGRGS